jgi:hypothetical protein
VSEWISWIDPDGWNQLLAAAGLDPVEPLTEGGEPRTGTGGAPGRRVARVLDRALSLRGAEAAYLVDGAGAVLLRMGGGEDDLSGLAASVADLVDVFDARRRRGAGPKLGMAVLGLGGPRRLNLVEAELGAGGRSGHCGLAVLADRSLSDREMVDLQGRLSRALG